MNNIRDLIITILISLLAGIWAIGFIICFYVIPVFQVPPEKVWELLFK